MATSQDAADVDHLRALPYAGFSSRTAQEGRVGVVIFDRSRSGPGFNLYSNRSLCNARLIDPRGRVVRAWGDAKSRHWSNVELLENGDLLVLGSQAGRLPLSPPEHYIMRLAWDGSERWRQVIGAHHDAERLSDGRIAVLTQRYRSLPGLPEGVVLKDNAVAYLRSADGAMLEEHSLYDLLATRPDILAIQEVEPSTLHRRQIVDLLHANSLEHVQHDRFSSRSPLFEPGNVLVSFRHQDVVAIFDLRAGELVWAWGRGELSGPHDATLLDNGNILIFDNGLGRGWSRVVEVDPLAREVVWQFRAPTPTDFYTESRGSSQRLGNANTLIANSDNGGAFEVTPEGDVVWRFFNHDTDSAGRYATLVRMKRYPVPWIAALPRTPPSSTHEADCG